MKRWRIILAGIGGVATTAALALGVFVWSLGPAPLGRHLEYSHAVLDRNGKLLRAYATSEGRWRLPATGSEVDPRFLSILFAYEDKRFLNHRGVDPEAMARAAWQLVSTGHIVSGGSTLTMQVARLLEPREHRDFGAKLRQIVRALELEHDLSKAQILSLYLSLAPYGGNLEGIRAASLAYFGHEPAKLSLAEAALLVALPQSPELRRPDRYPERAQAARDRVLDRAADAGAVPRDEIARAKLVPVPHERKPLPVLAPHSSDHVVAAEPGHYIHRLTIDADLQRTLEELARERARALGPQISVAILAVDNATSEVRARVASADYFDTHRAGQVDMTAALRSPGSTLKPFIYGLGFEDGLIHPETLIDDKPVRFGSYTPENFDLTFQGTVSVRRALQFSLNVPAIAVLGKLGVNRLSTRLNAAGAALVLPKGEAPGLAMGLGGVGIDLNDLVMLYTGLAREGSVSPLIERADAMPTPPPRVLTTSARSGGRLVRRQCADRRAAAAERGAGSRRLQDRHIVRLPRRLGGRLRRPLDDWSLGRAAGRRAGAGHLRARDRGADPVRCVLPRRASAFAAAAAAQGRHLRQQQPPAAAVAALPPRRCADRLARTAAYHVPAGWRAARNERRCHARHHAAEDRRRCCPALGAG